MTRDILQNTAASAESAAALTQLTQVLEKSIEGSLNAVADSFDSLLGRVLTSEQKRTDFQPSEMGTMGHMDTPTPACVAVTSLLRALQNAVEEFLPMGASGSFLLEVCHAYVAAWFVVVRRECMVHELGHECRWACHCESS